jgi:hypothetical protein
LGLENAVLRENGKTKTNSARLRKIPIRQLYDTKEKANYRENAPIHHQELFSLPQVSVSLSSVPELSFSI